MIQVVTYPTSNENEKDKAERGSEGEKTFPIDATVSSPFSKTISTPKASIDNRKPSASAIELLPTSFKIGDGQTR
jgi:hypothetical protein